MFESHEMRSAAQFPFSDAARAVLRIHGFTLEKTPREVLRRAARFVLMSGKPKTNAELEKFFGERTLESEEWLREEIQAFPIAKILVSAMGDVVYLERFSDLVAKQTFFYISREERDEPLFSLAQALSAKAMAVSDRPFFAQVPLSEFLRAPFRGDFLKLVNCALENGQVYLTRNDFARLLSELAREAVYSSLPVSLEHVPLEMRRLAVRLREDMAFRRSFELENISLGEVVLDAFPPCMAKIYSELSAGQSVNHPARFNLATFLVHVGMKTDEIVDVFRKAPNFDEKITRYQVSRIAGAGSPKYSPSSCAKMREYELCVANCPVTHPMTFYRQHKQPPSASSDSAVAAK